MYTSTFTFAPGEYDDAFHALDDAIATMARAIPGYLGEETWTNASSGVVSNVYYWESLQALETLLRHPDHIAAKRQQSKWLAGYQVVVAQVIGAYGDGGLDHPLSARPVAFPQRPMMRISESGH